MKDSKKGFKFMENCTDEEYDELASDIEQARKSKTPMFLASDTDATSLCTEAHNIGVKNGIFLTGATIVILCVLQPLVENVWNKLTHKIK